MIINPFKIASLAKRFMLGVIPISLGGILLLGFSAFYVTKVYIIRNVKTEITVFSQGAAASVSNFFRQRGNDVETLAESTLFADYHNNADYGLREEAEQYRGELERYLLKFSKRYTGIYTRITYVDAKKQVVCAIENSGIVPAGKRFRGSAIIEAVASKKDGTLRLPITDDPVYGHQITYAKLVFDEARNLRGVIVLDVSLKPLQEILHRLQVGSTGETYLADAAGKPLLSAGSLTARAAPPSDFVASAPVDGTDFRVLVAAPMSDFQAPLRTISRLTVVLVLVCGGLVVLFIYFTIRSMTLPIKKLVEATRNLARGRLAEKVKIESTDEIGLLAESFNAMSGQLMERTDELHSRIKELLVLHGMSAELLENLEESHICRICLTAAATAIGFERGVLYLVNREKAVIEGRYVHFTDDVGFDESSMRLRAIPLDSDDILATVVRSKKSINVKEPRKDPRVNKRYIEELATKAFCLVPMISGDKVIGVIGTDNYYSGREITDEQVKNLSLFGNFTALALENATLVSDIKASKERYRTVLDNSPDAIIGLTPAFHITVWNSGAQALFGYAPEEIVGQLVSKLFDPLAFEGVIREVIQKGFFSRSCVEGLNSQGGKLELDVTWAGSGKPGNRDREWTVVIRDTSEQRKLQSQLIQAEKLSAVGQLISGVAHELNNPLTAVLGYSEIMKRTGTNPVSVPAEDVTAIYESALRCGEIVHNLLAFVRESRAKRQPVDVCKIAASSIALMSYRLNKVENITITQKSGDHIPPVMADYHQIEQILVNLIRNACDALAQKSGEKKIAINVLHQMNSVFISVSDNGTGIPEELRSRIFEPFFTTKEEGQGTGLGLPICRRIATEHGGTINCDSIPGEGATFTLELPIVKIPKLKSGDYGETLRKPPPGKNILVVDDEPDILSLVKRILESEGQTVHTASCGLEAVEKLKKGNYDLVICDMEMGPMRGFSVREVMLEMNSSASLIFTTGNLLNTALIEKLKTLKVPFLPKPFNVAQLLSAMDETLS